MEKFLKILKNYYIVFSVCVITLAIVGGVYGVKFYNENKLKEIALAPPPVYVEPAPQVSKIETKVEKKKTENPEQIKIVSKNENTVETMAIPQKETFKISMPSDSKEIIKEYSEDELVYSKTFDDYRVHKGIDIKCKRSEAVFAAADGTVEDVFTDSMEGITIVINHNNGFKSVYKNLSSDKMVKKGEGVTKGQVISGVGESAIFESEDENHLHFELLKDDIYVNPSDFLM